MPATLIRPGSRAGVRRIVADSDLRYFAAFDTRIGFCAVAWSDEGITDLQLPDKNKAQLLKRMRERGRNYVEAEKMPDWIKRSIADVMSHLDGNCLKLSTIKIDFTGVPPFHRKVYEAARKIGVGQTVTYGELAYKIGSPKAARAVGQALARNPIAVIVPCHRILAAGGAGGFSSYGGCDTKAKLLRLEGVLIKTPGLRFTPGDSATLPFDGKRAVKTLSEADPKMADLIQRVGPLRLQLEDFGTPFEALAQSIAYQQLTGKAAATIYGRVKALFKNHRLTPRAVLAVADADLRAAGLSGSKVLSMKDLAAKAHDGLIPSLKDMEDMSDDEIIESLIAVRGIGRWTVEMLLMFKLGRPDVLPIHDYGVKKGFAQTYGWKELPTPKELEKFGERWRPYRTVASWYLWRALELPRK